ncbi:MAG: hypothetical protein ACI865_003389 [Flavobacteriaceae bacterium]|jgi:hypothetical protein
MYTSLINICWKRNLSNRGTIFVHSFSMMRLIVSIVILSSTYLSYGQDCDQVLFMGQVEDSLRPKGFYNLMVINRSTGQGVFGQPNGHFSVYANNGDTIALSITGYPVANVVVIGDSNCQSKHLVYIEGEEQELAQVVVRPLKSLEQIRAEREGLALRETRMVTGMEMIQSPITALYQAFSKKERTKRWIAKQEHQDDQFNVLKDLIRTYVAYDVINLSNDEFEEFIHFLNMDEQFLRTASEMELITFIQDKYIHYTLVKEGGGNSTVFDRIDGN